MCHDNRFRRCRRIEEEERPHQLVYAAWKKDGVDMVLLEENRILGLRPLVASERKQHRRDEDHSRLLGGGFL